MDSPLIVTPPASNGGPAIIELHGEHDLATHEDVAAALAALDNGNGVVDLSACTFIDSMIIGVLVGHSLDQPLAVVAPPGTPPRRALDLVGPVTTFRILDERPR